MRMRAGRWYYNQTYELKLKAELQFGFNWERNGGLVFTVSEASLLTHTMNTAERKHRSVPGEQDGAAQQ